jgi:hypothetical protein
MTMKIRSFAVAMALAGAPAVLAAQQGTAPAAGQHQHGQRGAWGQRGERRGGGALQALLAHRQELNLTDAQVQRLTAISQRLEQQNAPLQAQLRQLFTQAGLPDFRARREQGQQGEQQGQARQRPQLTEQQRQAFQRVRQQAQPIRQQMRKNMQAAVQEAKGVLTQQQQDQVKQYIQQHRRQGEGRGEGRGQWQGRRGAQQDSAATHGA